MKMLYFSLKFWGTSHPESVNTATLSLFISPPYSGLLSGLLRARTFLMIYFNRIVFLSFTVKNTAFLR